MSDYKERFEKWQRRAAQKFDEIDAQLGLKEKLEDGAKVVADAARSGADIFRKEAEKSDLGKRAVQTAENVFHGAESAAKSVWNASEPVRDVASDAGKTAGGVVFETAERAGEVIDDTVNSVGSNAKRVVKVVGLGSSVGSTFSAGATAAGKAVEWAKNDPMRAAATGAAMAIGAGLGVVVTGISSHWLLNSAIPTWTVKKLADSFDGYLRRRERLIFDGQLSQAERERVEFERDLAKRVGAPLLGSFAIASGAVMMSNVFNPTVLTGFPIGNIIGGNPVLEGIWFFGNGVVCLKTGYDFFMIALDDDEDIDRLVREIKGLLPVAA